MVILSLRRGRVEDLVKGDIIRRQYLTINPLKEADLSDSRVPEKVP